MGFRNMGLLYRTFPPIIREQQIGGILQNLFLSILKKLLSENKHVKYLYIPYTDTVVVVKCNPVSKWKGPPKFTLKYSSAEAIQHVRDLYRECLQKYR
ncbi:hypothetical protein PS2_009140 [Malus domestica]